MSIDNRRDRVAKALADFDQTPFGEMTLTKPDGTDPRIIDTRAAYRREAERFMAMLNAAMEPSARPTPPTEPPREWDMREATLNQSGCEVLIAFESAARACQFFDDVMEHPVLVPLPAPPKPLETER